MNKHKLILASASPRRKELLQTLGLDFDVVISDTDEGSVDCLIPASLYVQELALIKATAVCDEMIKYSGDDAIIISADTVVYNNLNILGKPVDENDAFNMLKDLSGKVHEVYTGICVMRTSDLFTVCDNRMTKVFFKELSDEKIKDYIATKEPMDKAGAYGIQGLGSTLIEKIDGDYFNVVGLPLEALARILEDEFGIDIF